MLFECTKRSYKYGRTYSIYKIWSFNVLRAILAILESKICAFASIVSLISSFIIYSLCIFFRNVLNWSKTKP
ncbi:hypothetical protein BD560DRAFT_383986 [Blakeslea trispora]|nr:hypothetical protein BD560DRAFT_383986 [Blakeslea trispora]